MKDPNLELENLLKKMKEEESAEKAKRRAERKARRQAQREAISQNNNKEKLGSKVAGWIGISFRFLLKTWFYTLLGLVAGTILIKLFGSDAVAANMVETIIFFTVIGIFYFIAHLFIGAIIAVLIGLLVGEISVDEVAIAASKLNGDSDSSNDGLSPYGEVYYQVQVRGGTTWLNVGGPRNETGAINCVDHESDRNPDKKYRVVEKRNGRIVGTVYSR